MPQLIEILKRHHITSAWLFGSVLTDRFTEESDIDVFVEMDATMAPLERGRHLWAAYYELKDGLKRDVDLLSDGAIKHDFLRQEIHQTKESIYG